MSCTVYPRSFAVKNGLAGCIRLVRVTKFPDPNESSTGTPASMKNPGGSTLVHGHCVGGVGQASVVERAHSLERNNRVARESEYAPVTSLKPPVRIEEMLIVLLQVIDGIRLGGTVDGPFGCGVPS